MNSKKFTVKLRSQEPKEAGVVLTIPFNVGQIWGSTGRIAVRGTINGFSFRSSVYPNGNGTHSMKVSKSMLKGAHAEAGDKVNLVIEPDVDPRSVVLPDDFKAVLKKSIAANKAFAALAYTHRKAFIEWIESARGDESRANRIMKSVQMLLEGKYLK